MKYNALHDAGRFSKLRRNRKRWQKVVSVMASIVVFCTTYALILPAITMEQSDTYCGLENHIHGPECYEKVLICDHASDDVVEATPMANVTEGHTHDETCYEEIKNLICEQEEVVGHKHDSSCETLICSLEETSGHSHSDACYEIQYETKTWTEEVTVNDGEELTCTSTEEGHAHDGSCYTAKSHTETVERTEQVEVGRVLTCTTPESAPHSHDASCYQMVCTQEEVEGHTHTDECYTVERGELICEIPEVTEAPETTEPEVTDPAEPAHEHSDACYEEKLICGCEIEHEHTADCYIEPPYEPADDEELVCELEEHKHDDACLIAETGELICDLEEHSHDENCYEQLPAFEMWLPLDADIDLDVYTEKHEYIDEDGLYGVTVYAKPDTFDVPVTLEVELLEEDDDRYVNALDVLAAQVEETEEAEEEIVDEAADELAAIDEVTPENILPEEPAEPTSEAPVAEEEVVEDEVIEEEIIEEEVIEEEITAQPALTGEEGMIAFDIHFVDEDGDEVQPLEPVYVHIQAMGLLPEDVDLSTVTVQHIREEQPATWGARLLDMLPFVDETVYIPEVVADMIDEDLGWIDFEPNMDDDEIYDVNTAFEVDGFSTFTITWGNSTATNAKLTIYVVDVNGNNLAETTYVQNEAFSTNDAELTVDDIMKMVDPKLQDLYLRDIEGSDNKMAYHFVAMRADRINGTATEKLVYEGSRWKYVTYSSNMWGGSTTENKTNTNTVYLVYTTGEEVFRGVTPTGVTVNVFNYGQGINGDNNSAPLRFKGAYGQQQGSGYNAYTNGSNAYGGIVKSTLGADGMPEMADEKGSLAYLFNPSVEDGSVITDIDKNAQYLFQIDKDGNYYYDSSENFAVLDEDGDFYLYDDADSDVSYAPYSAIGTTTDDGYYLGTHINGPFLMPKDGYINGDTTKPMIFKFSGDDDVWVFIDGVLVLDIGGIHQESAGSINFATGRITQPGYVSGHSGPGTDLYNIIGKAKEAAGEIEWIEKNMEYTTDNSGNKTYTGFKDYSTHTIDFFYLERGAGSSNCEIYFNLQTVPENSLSVEKQVTNIPTDVLALLGELEYKFQVLTAKEFKNADGETVDELSVTDEDGNVIKTYEPNTILFPKGTKYSVYKNNGTELVEANRTVGENGIFTLKHGERAVFSEETSGESFPFLLANAEIPYTARELLEDGYVQQYNGVQYEITNAGGAQGTTEDITTGDLKDFTTMVSPQLTGSMGNGYVQYKNVVNQQKLSWLYVEKVGGKPGETYNMEVKVNNELLPVGTKYKIVGKTYAEGEELPKVETAGIIPLEANQSVLLNATLVVGSTYTVTEQDPGDDFTVTYAKTTGTVGETESAVNWTPVAAWSDTPVEGTVAAIGSYNKLLVKNAGKSGNLEFGKEVVHTGNGTITDEFTFTVSYSATENAEYIVEYTDTPAGVTRSGTIKFVAADGVATANVGLYDGETIQIRDLNADTVVTITETTTDGYSVKWETEDNGAPNGAAITMTVASGGTVGATCVNTTGYALPSTGGIGTTLYTMSGMAMMSAALVGGYGLRRKRERGSEE